MKLDAIVGALYAAAVAALWLLEQLSNNTVFVG